MLAFIFCHLSLPLTPAAFGPLFPSWQSGIYPPTPFFSGCLHFSLSFKLCSSSPSTHLFYPLCPLFWSFVSICLCHIFCYDFGEQWSLWPSDNNVLDRYILACMWVHASMCICVCVQICHLCVCVCVCLCVCVCVYNLLRHISLGSACGWALSF